MPLLHLKSLTDRQTLHDNKNLQKYYGSNNKITLLKHRATPSSLTSSVNHTLVPAFLFKDPFGSFWVLLGLGLDGLEPLRQPLDDAGRSVPLHAPVQDLFVHVHLHGHGARTG